MLSQLAVSHLDMSEGTARKDVALLESASLFAVISTGANDRISRVKAGQVLLQSGLVNTLRRQVVEETIAAARRLVLVTEH